MPSRRSPMVMPEGLWRENVLCVLNSSYWPSQHSGIITTMLVRESGGEPWMASSCALIVSMSALPCCMRSNVCLIGVVKNTVFLDHFALIFQTVCAPPSVVSRRRRHRIEETACLLKEMTKLFACNTEREARQHALPENACSTRDYQLIIQTLSTERVVQPAEVMDEKSAAKGGPGEVA